jgi:hypothetical protein
MTNLEWMEVFRGIPEAEHNKLVIVLQNGAEVTIDTLFRFETTFMLIRGRLGGTIEEARAFFVPYDQMLYVRLERIVKLEELDSLVSSSTPIAQATAPSATPVQAPVTPASSSSLAAGASRKLIDKIRANRANASGSGQ